MPDVGQGQIAQLTVDDFDGTTSAALAVVSPVPRVSTPVSAATADSGHTWTANVPAYTTGGLWYHVWTVTGKGAGRKVFEVQVGPDVPGLTYRSYATTAQLADYLMEAPPAGAERMLRDATVLVDRLLLTAVYETTGADEMPADAAVAKALREATCELVRWWDETGDSTGAMAVAQSASIGSVSVGRGSAGRRVDARSTGDRVGPQALAILENAGLLSRSPWRY